MQSINAVIINLRYNKRLRIQFATFYYSVKTWIRIYLPDIYPNHL